MSIRYVAAVLDRLTHLSAPESLVLIALADFASDDTREAWPSLATLMRRSRLSRRGVQRILRRLESTALIETALGGNQVAKGTPNCYRLRFTYDGERMETVEAPMFPGGKRRVINKGDRTSPSVIHKGDRHDTKGDRRDTEGRPGVAPSVIDPSLNQRAFDKRLKTGKSVDKSENVSRDKPVAAKSLAALHEELRKRKELEQ